MVTCRPTWTQGLGSVFGSDLANLKLPVAILTADADIEYVTLVDIQGMRRFLGLPDNAEPKGETKFRSPYKTAGVTRPYRAGERACERIYSFSFETVE